MNSRRYSLSEIISNESLSFNLHGGPNDNDEIKLRKSDPKISAFLLKLIDLGHISLVILNGCDLTIMSTDIYWNDFEPKIFKALKECFGFEDIRRAN